MSTQAAHDLCWAINTPSLVAGENVAVTEPITLDEIDADHLRGFLAGQPESRRVGRYFEHLVHYWLKHVRKVEVVETGLQLKDGKITVGEIDFLYRNERDQLVHLETSIKFFLHAPGATPSEFPGPNARDNFEAKATKLFDKQLPASNGRIDDVAVREGLVKGLIFYPDDVVATPWLDRLAPDHLTGRWFHATAANDLETLGGAFTIMDKPHWLAPTSTDTRMTFAQLAERLSAHFSSTGHPLMLSVCDEATPAVETSRCFVVPETWPTAHPGQP